MKMKSLKKLELNKATVVELNKQDVEALKGQGTCGCNESLGQQNIIAPEGGGCTGSFQICF